jgi:hypothetical protein
MVNKIIREFLCSKVLKHDLEYMEDEKKVDKGYYLIYGFMASKKNTWKIYILR